MRLAKDALLQSTGQSLLSKGLKWNLSVLQIWAPTALFSLRPAMHFPGSECSLLRFAETNHNFRIVREFSTNNYSQVSACSTSSCKLVMVSCRSDLASSTVFLANFPSFSERWTEDRFLVWCKTGQKKALLLHRTKTRHKPNFGMSGDSSCVRAVSKLYFVH